MHISPPAQRVLKLVFAACSATGAINRPRLERRSGLSRPELNRSLEELARVGLLDAQRLRLTLSGLALAVACGARDPAAPRPAASHSSRPPVSLTCALSAPLALFSQREVPRAVA